ncbi:MAG TPA: hypothetical protein VF444_21300 [Pseudonocardiaceae bacterium]
MSGGNPPAAPVTAPVTVTVELPAAQADALAVESFVCIGTGGRANAAEIALKTVKETVRQARGRTATGR